MEVIKRFKPSRPIYLNSENTGKSEAEVLVAVEDLRKQGWLVAYNVKEAQPFHLSFDDESEVQAFKKAASDLGLKLKSVVLVDLDTFEPVKESKDPDLVESKSKKSK